MTAETDLLPLVGTLRALPEHVQGVVQAYARANVANAIAPLQAEVEALRADVDGTIRELLAERDQLAAENARLREEIGRLLDSREREGDRLDWLLARLPGDVIRDLVGEMSCTSDAGEWRDRIDKAARFKIPNP